MIVKQTARKNGFTIVELLIVIVVVAVLATLSYVGYTNISNRAHDSAVQADLRQFGQTISLHYAELGTYSGSLSQLMPYGGFQAARESYATSFTGSDTGNYLYCFNNITQQFGLVARSRSGNYFQVRGWKRVAIYGSGYDWRGYDVSKYWSGISEQGVDL